MFVLLAGVACGSSDNPIADTEPGITDADDSVPSTPSDDVTNKVSHVIGDFTAFLDQQGISDGAIAVSYNSELIDSAGVNRQPGDNVPVASLSKAITAVCAMKALDLQDLEPSLTLLDIMPDILTDLELSDQRLQDVTVEQLLFHNSGIHLAHISELGADIPTMRLEQKLWQLEYIAREGLSAEPGSGYYYANANYLILGLAIESIVQEDYESWCQREVLMPIGIDTARLSPRWAVLSSFGGWEISAVDYLNFINSYFKPDDMLGLDPASTNFYTPIGGGALYSLGTLLRLTPAGAVYWHAGSFTWRSAEQSGRFGAYYAVYTNGFSVVVNLSDNLDGDRGIEIDRLLGQLAQ